MRTIVLIGISIAAVVGSAAPGFASKVVPREVTCPIDGRKFKAVVQLSGYQTGRRLDLRPVGRIAAPSPMPVCPGSGFPVFKDDFDAGELGKIKRILNTAEYKKIKGKHPSYFVAAFIKQKLGYDKSEVAMDVLRSVWQAEKDEDYKEAFYLEEALRRFDELAKSSSPSDKSWATASFLTVELSRRLGKFDDAAARLARFEADVNRARVDFRQALIVQEKELIAKRDAAPQIQHTGKEAEKGERKDD